MSRKYNKTKNINKVEINPKIIVDTNCVGGDETSVPQLVFNQGVFDSIGQDFKLVSQVVYDFVGTENRSSPFVPQPLVFHASVPHVITGLGVNNVEPEQNIATAQFLLTKQILAAGPLAREESEEELFTFVDTSMMDMPKVTSFQYVDEEVSLPAIYRLYARVDNGKLDSTSEFSFTARQYQGRP